MSSGWDGSANITWTPSSSLPLVELKAVCTRTESRLKEIKEKYRVPKAYTDYHEMLADKDIDMVSIVTHIKEHLQPTLDAFAAGKHVFLEKPMADSIEDCDRIIAAAAKAGTCFMVGHIRRFDTVYALAKEEIEAGNLGSIISMHARRNLAKWITPSHLKKISALFGDGVHDLDLMLWYSGAKPKTVYAQSLNTRPELPNDDLGWAMLRLDSGAIAVIENIWCLPENAPYALSTPAWRSSAPRGADPQTPRQFRVGYTVLKKEGLPSAVDLLAEDRRPAPRVSQGRARLLHALHLERGKKPTVITPQESRLVVHAMKTAERSARENKVITFVVRAGSLARPCKSACARPQQGGYEMQFEHIGLITNERKAGEDWVEATRVWVTNPREHPFHVEWLRYEPDSPVTGPVREKSHVAYSVENLAEASRGAKGAAGAVRGGRVFPVGFYEYKDGDPSLS